MGIAIDADCDVAIVLGVGYHHLAIMAGVVDYTLGYQRPCVPQFGAVCLAIDLYPANGLYHYAILDVLARISLLGT